MDLGLPWLVVRSVRGSLWRLIPLVIVPSTSNPFLSGFSTLALPSQLRQVDPRPCLICWAGLRTPFCLALTVSPFDPL